MSLTVSLGSELGLEPIALYIMDPDGDTIGVAADDSVVIFVVRAEEVVWILWPDKDIMSLLEENRDMRFPVRLMSQRAHLSVGLNIYPVYSDTMRQHLDQISSSFAFI